MGPKKEVKKAPQKRDQSSNIEEPINTDSWRCVVVMAVERTSHDSFVLKEFMEEFSHGRRREVGLIDFDTFVLKILKDFVIGELSNKYSSLLNFSFILQEASEYVTKETDIPTPVLAKVVKVLLLHFREESLIRLEKKAAGPQDPILAMAERPPNWGAVDTKKKEPTKKGDNPPKVRPQSITKEDTRLLKRGEPVKDDQCIDDAPLNGYFNLYVLLTGFYQADFPLELLKGGVPLHGLLCIDTALSGLKRDAPGTDNRFQKLSPDTKIQNFWNAFLKILWDPKTSPYFKDTIFQVYVPRRLCCEKKKLREFVYREISYLMYDLSDFKRQLNNYLGHLKLWDVEEKDWERYAVSMGLKSIAEECMSAPVVLQCVIDAICGEDDQCGESFSSDSIDSTEKESEPSDKSFTLSAQALMGSYGVRHDWSQALIMKPDLDLLRVYHKTKELDVKYDLDDRSVYFHRSERKSFVEHVEGNSQTTCEYRFQFSGENMKEALAADGALRSYWKGYPEHTGTSFALDYCLYPLLMTRVFCPYLPRHQTPTATSTHSLKKNSNFELIENLDRQMRRPHFTVTDSSRSILKAFPYNMKDTAKDFFSPAELKVVSPEMVKASSAPHFRVGRCPKVHRAFTSEIFSQCTSDNIFTNLREFLGESLLANTNGFDFVEMLGKEQLLERKETYWNSYTCVDHVYSIVGDCIFVALHNRTEGENIHHETFNEALKTGVGLRDFYEYVLEDEADWLASQERSLHLLTVCKKDSTRSRVLNDFSESEFWLPNSIKYEEGSRLGRRDAKESAKAKSMSGEKAVEGTRPASGDVAEKSSFTFEGYNVSDMAVQFSGLKTVYYSNDCSMTVQLCERLYGNQELGIHVTAGGHSLHFYSYVCPEPHILDPFTFHLTYKNGIIVAFTRRFIETIEEVEEVVESRTAATKGNKKNSSELSTRVVKREVLKTLRDEEFVYDMAASLPNGLCIRTVRRLVEPCYIVQQHRGKTCLENSRLFLPNGNIVRMLSNDTVEVLKPDTSIMTASLRDLASQGEPHFESFNFVSSEGYSRTFQNGQMTPAHRMQILQNTDLDTNQTFFRRQDGTSYMLQGDGSLCVEFKDGTKIYRQVFLLDPSPEEDEAPGGADSEADFSFVYMKTTMEHPDYATLTYDTCTQKWTVVLPYDSTITVDPDGQYSLDIDERTEVRAEGSVIQLKRYSSGRQLECAATAELSVFESKEGGVYCHMEDLEGKIFIVEPNSNCYILDEEQVSEDSDTREESSHPTQSRLSLSEFVASEDLQRSPSVDTERSTILSRSNKYFVLKRDMTGFQMLHEDDVSAALSERDKASLLFIEPLPATDNRLFVLITPQIRTARSKWQVASVLPEPRYKPNASKRKTSSTYGSPPSWMHPFPKRKPKFHVPYPLSCRVFIETKRTKLSPAIGEIGCSFCEVDDAPEVQLPVEGVEEYLKRLSSNEQQLLGEMYAHVAESLINKKRKLKSVHSEKLEHYLDMSKYYVMLQEYHKESIRYHKVPNYFHHPAGMSWLILNQALDKMLIPIPEESATQVPPPPAEEGSSDLSTAPSKPTSSISGDEIEYNMSCSEAASFSELSYKSDLSAATAPAVLRTGGLCRCKVRVAKGAASAPFVKCYCEEDGVSLEEFGSSRPGVCDFQEEDLEMLGKGEREAAPMTLEDLACLGLV